MMTQWQTMETAPTDGTLIDLLYPYPRGRTINCSWSKILHWHWKEPRFDPETMKVLPESEWFSHTYPNIEPTHWMPVPAEPAA